MANRALAVRGRVRIVTVLAVSSLVAGLIAGITGPAVAAKGPAAVPVRSRIASAGRVASQAPVELPARRTANSYTYATAQGFESKIYPVAVNYRDSSGHFVPIDDTLVAVNGGGWHNVANSYGATLPADASSPVRYGSGGNWVSYSLVGAAGPVSVSGATASYRNALPGLDLAYTATANVLKENLTLHSAAAGADFDWLVSGSSGLTPVAQPDGGIGFNDASGQAVISFAAPTVTDAAGAAGPARLAIAPTASGWDLSLSIDPTWLAAPGRVWPVIADPDTFSSSSYPDCTLSSATPSTSSCNAQTMTTGYAVANTQRSILTFPDLDSTVSPNGLVENADVQVYVNAISVAGSYSIAANALTQSWTTSATWNTYDGSNSWPTSGSGCPSGSTCGAGGDYTTAAADTATVSATGWVHWYPTALVQGWMRGTIPNDGMVLKEATENQVTAITFDSSQNSNTGDIPVLSVDWTLQQGDQSIYSYMSHAVDDRAQLKVNLADGDLLYSGTDLNYSGVGLPASFSRSYNSIDAGDVQDAGFGWHMGFAQDMTAEVYTTSVVINSPTDTKMVFTRARNTYSFTSPPGADADLTSPDSGTTYKLTFHSSQTVWTFGNVSSSTGQLLSIADRNGNTLSFHFPCTNGCQSDYATDSEGRKTTFAYQASSPNYITSMTDPSSPARTASYGYTGTQLTTYTDPASNNTTYAYDSSNNLTKITDPVGNIVTASYDVINRLSSLTYVTNNSTLTGPTYNFAYATNLLTANQASFESGTTGWQAVSPATIAQSGAHSDDGNYSMAVTAGGSSAVAETLQGTLAVPAGANIPYSGYAESKAGTTGRSFTVGIQFFNSSGTLISTATSPASTDNTSTWSTATVTTYGPPGTAYMALVVTYSGTSSGEVHYVDNAGIETTHSFDWRHGLPISLPSACAGTRVNRVQDPNGNFTYYCATLSDQIVGTIDPKNNFHSGTFTSDAQPATLTDAVSSVTTLNYDNNNNLTSMVAPKSGSGGTGTTWSAAYNTTGATGATYLASSSTDPQGNCRAYTYDGVGNLTNTYDAQASGCDGKTAGNHFSNAYQHDTGVASCTSDGLTTTYPGILCSTTYPNQAGSSNTITYAYTFASTAPKTLSQIVVTQPGGTCTAPRKLCNTETFDTLSRLSTVTDSSSANSGAGEKTTYCYDKLDRITQLWYTAPSTTPTCGSSGASEAYTYDADGHLTQRVDGTGTATFGYDTLGRLVAKSTGTTVCTVTAASGSGSGTTCFGYDSNSNMTSFTDSSGTTSYTYDAANNLTTLVEPTGTSGCSIGTTGTLCTAFSYDADNRRTETQYPGGATLVVGYDPAGNETSVVGKSSTGSTLTSFAYCYETLSSTGACPTGTVTDTSVVTQAYENDPRATLTTDYGYDLASRLCWAGSTYSSTATCASPPSGDDTYAYDGAGNRTSQTVGGTTSYYLFNGANEVCSKASVSTGTCAAPPSGATTYTFDGIGNLTGSASPTSSFTYNTGANQTTAITDNSVTLSSMAYADVGQSERTTLTQGSNTTSFLTTPMGVDKSTTGSSSTYVVRDPQGNLVGYVDGSGTHWYYLLDDHGSVVSVINNSGSTVGNRYAYDEYGRSTYTFGSPTVTQPWGYAAGYGDGTGLTKFGTRYYDPTIGRWTQQDPLGGLTSRYTYADDGPTDFVDPDGMVWYEPWTWSPSTRANVGTGVGCAVGIIGGALLTAGPGALAGVAGCETGIATDYLAQKGSSAAGWAGAALACIAGAATAGSNWGEVGFAISTCETAVGFAKWAG